MKYLTEKLLGDFLKKLYGVHNVIEQFPVDGTRMKIDYKVTTHDGRDLFVEFDGDSHYCRPDVIYRDGLKKDWAGDMLIRIPYFVQLDEFTIRHYFGVNIWDYPNMVDGGDYNYFTHGFVSSKVVFPSQFCSQGINRFFAELKVFDELDYGDAIGRILTVSDSIRLSLVNHKAKHQKHAYGAHKIVEGDMESLLFVYDRLPGVYPIITDNIPKLDYIHPTINVIKKHHALVLIGSESERRRINIITILTNMVYKLTIYSHMDDLRDDSMKVIQHLDADVAEDDIDDICDLVYELRLM
jgi:hypothetical protein